MRCTKVISQSLTIVYVSMRVYMVCVYMEANSLFGVIVQKGNLQETIETLEKYICICNYKNVFLLLLIFFLLENYYYDSCRQQICA